MAALISCNTAFAQRRAFSGKAVQGATNGSRTVMAKAGQWCPGLASPAYLDGSMPGDYGFDPLKLGEVPSNLARFKEGEVINGRWAMLATVGCLAVELLGFGTWADAPKAALQDGATYFGIDVPLNLPALVAIEVLLMAGAEIRRSEEADPEKRLYPGGSFNPMGLGKTEEEMETLKLKEIKNGRLAMVSWVSYNAQYAATGKGPIAALVDHLNSPATANFATNDVSIPFLVGL